jgi:LytS/YehU family sensor histidine kinase
MHLMFTTTLQTRGPAWREGEMAAAAIGLACGLVIAFVVYRLARRVPWPRPFRLRFLALHLVAAPVAAMAWGLSATYLALLVPGYIPDVVGSNRVYEFLVIGTVIYAIVVGVAHAEEGSARATRAEAVAARTQLAALRAQVQPHFLFNALHTIVQLIPADPARAMDAAELVADLLRTTLEEQRDEVPLEDEWRFVSRYLEMERIRFGDRLAVRADMPEALLHEPVPAFALQTLVENAVLHGAAPRVAPTEIVVTAAGDGSALTITVRNSGDGGSVPATGAAAAGTRTGTGLARLRERLAVLYGNAARLECGPDGEGGYQATLVVPRSGGRKW